MKPSYWISFILLSLTACGQFAEDHSQVHSTNVITWKGALMAGYYNDKTGQAEAWDNATKKIRDLIGGTFGQQVDGFKRYSKDKRKIGQDAVTGESNLAALEQGLSDLSIGANDACFIFMTSHGSKDGGFNIERERSIYPDGFFAALENKCGSRKTVAIISACYSGAFVEYAKQQNKSNMVVLSAAANVPSFGCDASREYTFYDQCLVETLSAVSAKSLTWSSLYDQMKSCVTKMEGGMERPSNPQAYLGTDLANEFIFSSIGSSSSSTTSGIKINLAGSMNSSINFDISTEDKYDRVIVCKGNSADNCELTLATTQTIASVKGRKIFKMDQPIPTISSPIKVFIFAFLAGNTTMKADTMRSIQIENQ